MYLKSAYAAHTAVTLHSAGPGLHLLAGRHQTLILNMLEDVTGITATFAELCEAAQADYLWQPGFLIRPVIWQHQTLQLL